MSRYRITNEIVSKLEEALDALPNGYMWERCNIDPKVKANIQNYLRTWAAGPLESALKKIKGKEYD